MRRVLIPILGLALFACGDGAEENMVGSAPFQLHIPAGFPVPMIPAENPLTEASVRLGKALFFEKRLSRDGSVSCASCHRPEHAFSDTVPRSIGVKGKHGMRNAPTLANVAYHAALFRDGVL
ncbi:MAG TPA: cytochrome-c peroxidase, partial [Flavobacteriales bacterium]|nr:cytochrome-c peroxidase [Flavobacteriales bacterium]